MRYPLAILSLILLAACSGDEDGAMAGGYGGRNHVIQEGENLFSIAQREYGNGLLWPEIRRANPWVHPYRLRPGETIHIPPLESDWQYEASRRAGAANPGPITRVQEEVVERAPEPEPASDRGNRFGFANVSRWGDTFNQVSSKTLFGLPIAQVVLFAFCGLLSHSFVQGILVWLATIFTFVKETSFRRSLKAVVLTETLTFSTFLTLGILAIVMVYLGSSPEEAARNPRLFPALEDYLGTESGISIAAIALLLVNVVLSLRFFPQVLGIKIGQAVPVMTLAVLLPHALGFYFIGQRIGLIP